MENSIAVEIMIGTLNVLITVITVHLLNEYLFKKKKKEVIFQITIEILNLKRHLDANIKAYEKMKTDQKSIDGLLLNKMKFGDVFLQTIDKQNFHPLRLPTIQVTDILQATLILRNTDLQIADLVSKMANNSNFENQVEDLIERFRNLSLRLEYLIFNLFLRYFSKNKGLKKYFYPQMSVWNLEIPKIKELFEQKEYENFSQKYKSFN